MNTHIHVYLYIRIYVFVHTHASHEYSNTPMSNPVFQRATENSLFDEGNWVIGENENIKTETSYKNASCWVGPCGPSCSVGGPEGVMITPVDLVSFR